MPKFIRFQSCSQSLQTAALADTSQVLEQRTPLGRAASAPILVMAVAALAAAAHAIPQACAAYDVVWAAVMPLGAALCLLEVDLTDLARCEQSGVQTAAWYGMGLLNK